MIMGDIDYNKLKFFLAVVRCQSVTRAASELHRTQSAISQAVVALEKQIGAKLIAWEGKKMKLTREGRLVYQAAEARIKAIDEELEAISLSGQEIAGCIEIGMLRDHSSRIEQKVFQIIAKFQKQYPKVTFNVRFATSTAIEQALVDHEIDIGILINYKEPQKFTRREIATEEHIVVSTPEFKIASVADVLATNIIDIDPYFTCFTPWISYHAPELRESLEKMRPAIVVPDFLAIKELVLAGAGIAVVPKYLVEHDLERGALVQVLPELLALRVWVTAATVRQVENRRSVDYFLRELLSQ